MSTAIRFEPQIPWQAFVDGLADAALKDTYVEPDPDAIPFDDRTTGGTSESSRFIQLAETKGKIGGLWFDGGRGFYVRLPLHSFLWLL